MTIIPGLVLGLNCLLIEAVLFNVFAINRAEAIACYWCNSLNGSDPKCEDPMPSDVRVENPCLQGREYHRGLFHTTLCLKIKANRTLDSTPLYIRRCSRGRLTDIDSHCGHFKIGNDTYKGCVETCNKDWCNRAVTCGPHYIGRTGLVLASTLVYLLSFALPG